MHVGGPKLLKMSCIFISCSMHTIFNDYAPFHITTNIHVVYMARYVIVLRRARSITSSIGRGGPWKLRIFGPEMAPSAASALWAQKSRALQGICTIPASAPASCKN